MKAWIVLGLCAALLGCASAPPVPAVDVTALFHDELFEPPSEPVDPARIFEASEAMKQFVGIEIARDLRTKGLRQGLADALYTRGQLRLDYDASNTRNAAEAFEARAGNCLSLVIMTAALAKELKMQVQFQSVPIDDSWSRSGDLLVLNGHVNVSLGQRLTEARHWQPIREEVTIDFLPPEALRGQRARPISESTVVAMYMNNRAAEALAAGRLDDGYWWAREALRQEPTFRSSYNTLGVIYLRRGRPVEAEQVLRLAWQQDPRNTRVIANLIRVQTELGRPAEAEQLSRKLAELEPYPPFHFMSLGVAALERGDTRVAREHFERELDRAPEQPELHYWLAVTYQRLGDIRAARKHLDIAITGSTNRDERAIYSAKLDRINALTAH
ncbi:tetratricopeptide repeat protein [Rivibacter subsaxonicus]|nr:tetratricopeptide repeat protein [Rivibacter subsaxonicus]